MTYEELIAKAKQVESAEELWDLSKEYGAEISQEDAKIYFALMNKTGELSDDELNDTAGGGCQTSGGQTVVTSGKKCFTGQYSSNWYRGEDGDWCSSRKDNVALRKLWWIGVNNLITDIMRESRFCGSCKYLEFKNGTGYCGKT